MPGGQRAVGWGRDRSQHIGYHRKYLLRKRLLRWASDGAAYVPFIGDGDLAADLYDQRLILGVDEDPERVDVAQQRLTGDIRVGDADGWLFTEHRKPPVAIADFDAWANPYRSMIAFWEHAPKADRLLLFFTDGMKIPLMADGLFIHPDGTREKLLTTVERQRAFYFYFSRTVWPWFEDTIRPYTVLDRIRYLQGQLLYFGAAIERSSGGQRKARELQGQAGRQVQEGRRAQKKAGRESQAA